MNKSNLNSVSTLSAIEYLKGIGINGEPINISWESFLAQALNLSNTTQSTSKDTGSLVLEGGLGVEKNLFVGEVITGNGLVVNNPDGYTSKIVTDSDGRGFLVAAQLNGGVASPFGFGLQFNARQGITAHNNIASYANLNIGTEAKLVIISLQLNIAGVVAYTNDSAATSAGLVTGDLYKKTTSGVTALCIVP